MSSWIEGLDEARYQAGELGNLVLALDLAAQVAREPDPEARYFGTQAVRWIAAQLGPEHGVDAGDPRLACADASSSLSSKHEPEHDHELGACGVLLADVDRAGHGFVARLSLVPGVVDGPLLDARADRAFRQAIRDAELAVLRWLRRERLLDLGQTLLSGYRLLLSGPPAARERPLCGGSLGLAAALALASLWTGRPLPRDLLVTGQLTAVGSIRQVERLQAKVEAGSRERPGARLVVPTSGELVSDLIRVQRHERLDLLLRAELGPVEPPPQAPLDLAGMVRKGLELFEKQNNYVAASEVLQQALDAMGQPKDRPDEGQAPLEFVARWRLGAVHIHHGKLNLALAELRKVGELGRRLWREGELDPADYLGFRNSHAVLLRDCGRYQEAEAELLITLASQAELRQSKRHVARTLGNLGELQVFIGMFAKARETLELALSHLRATCDEEVPRGLCNLGVLGLHAGQPQRALELFEQGLEHNRRVNAGAPHNARFLRYGAARALLLLGRWSEAAQRARAAVAEIPTHEPWPRQLILACEGIGLWGAGEREAGTRALRRAADTDFVDGAYLRFGVTTALGHLALLRLAAGQPDTDPVVAEAVTALRRAGEDLPNHQPIQRAMATMETMEPAPLSAALRRVIAAFPYGISAVKIN